MQTHFWLLLSAWNWLIYFYVYIFVWGPCYPFAISAIVSALEIRNALWYIFFISARQHLAVDLCILYFIYCIHYSEISGPADSWPLNGRPAPLVATEFIVFHFSQFTFNLLSTFARNGVWAKTFGFTLRIINFCSCRLASNLLIYVHFRWLWIQEVCSRFGNFQGLEKRKESLG